MFKKYIITIIILFTLIISILGCTTKKAENGTFGEKNISLDKIKITNQTSAHREYQDNKYFFIEGNITNANDIDAIDLKIEAIAYDENGTVVAINNTPYLVPKIIPAGHVSYFYFQFDDPDKRILRYEIKIISAKPRYIVKN